MFDIEHLLFGFFCFGTGQLACGEKRTTSLEPMAVTALQANKQHAVDTVCGERHTHILTKDGRIWSWYIKIINLKKIKIDKFLFISIF
jgi:alpha-tubulin suppressor-like RCC1 family protein